MNLTRSKLLISMKWNWICGMRLDCITQDFIDCWVLFEYWVQGGQEETQGWSVKIKYWKLKVRE